MTSKGFARFRRAYRASGTQEFEVGPRTHDAYVRPYGGAINWDPRVRRKWNSKARQTGIHENKLQYLKPDSHLSKSILICFNETPNTNDEKLFLFHLKSSFCSQESLNFCLDF